MNGPEDNNNDASASGDRWTCDFCGCITNGNQENPTSCSICGSRRQIPGILRRDEPLSAQLLRRAFFVRRGGGGADFQRSFNHRSLQEQIENGMMMDEDNDHAIAALALQVAGVSEAARIPGARTRREMMMRSVERIPYGLDAISSPSPPPAELLEIATANASLFNPHWETPSSLGMRRRENTLVLGEHEFANVATLPICASDGKSIRTAQHIPRLGLLSGAKVLRRKAVGFCVAFNRPFREAGKSLGGGYLVGVTTASFCSFDERNALQQSSLFWGIDDAGNKFEGGSESRIMRRALGRSRQSDGSINNQGTRSDDNEIYGCLETITVVVDIESRSLTFWCDGDLLGTLVANLPRSGALYAVAVPFNAGAMVAITGMNGGPVLSLQQYESCLCERKRKKERARHMELCQQRSLYVESGKPTEVLVTVLRQIFSLYCNQHELKLRVVVAARLWYRSGLKLKNLERVIVNKVLDTNCLYADAFVGVDEYLDIIYSILTEDELFFSEVFNTMDVVKWESPNQDNFEIGDIVELAEGYERYGDASRGPMSAGDRGQVVEIQQVSNGERHSIRVLFNGRRWWYQLETLLAEKSGLIATPAVWFIQRILRAHGYDHLSLTPLWGKAVTNSSWAVGDIVFPAQEPCGPDDVRHNSSSATELLSFGRIVPPSSCAGSQGSIPDREAGLVCVEFVDSLFGSRVGIENTAGEERISHVHRVKVKDLLHARFADVVGESVCSNAIENTNGVAERAESSSFLSDILSISKLEVVAIESVVKECGKSDGALARVFAGGLPNAVLQAIDYGREIVRNHDDQSNVLPAFAALGNLLIVTARHLYGDSQLKNISKTIPNLDAGILSETETMDRVRTGGDSQTYDLGVHHQESTLSGRFQHANEVVGFAQESHNQIIGTENPRGPSVFSKDPSQRLSGSLNLYSPALHSIRRGGFEALLLGDDARRGTPVLNAGLKSAIWNGILSNNVAWFYKMLETAKKKKGSTASALSVVNARDDDGMPLLALVIHFGCSTSIVSYLLRNGAIVCDESVRLAATLGQKNMLSVLLDGHIRSSGVVDYNACSQEIVDTIELASKRQKDHALTLHREGERFLLMAIKHLIRFAIECRSSVVPKRRVYCCITQILVGRVLLRALHLNRLKQTASVTNCPMPSKARPQPYAESGRVDLFPSTELVPPDKECAPSRIASSEALLFAIPSETLSRCLLRPSQDSVDCPLTDYLGLVEGLLWSKEVEDIAFGLTMASILLQARPLDAVSLRRFGIFDLIVYHDRDSTKRLKRLEGLIEGISLDPRRFSPHHVAAREHEVKEMLSSGVVLCPKCHPAELHITRHSSFRCDLCGNGVDRGFPMHGCRDCDWDACEVCINAREGGIVKWNYVQRLSRECLHVIVSLQECDYLDNPAAQVSQSEWSRQVISARINALDTEVLTELALQLTTHEALTLFEFSTYILPGLRDALCGNSNAGNTSPPSQYDPPAKKRKAQFLQHKVGDRPGFVDKFMTALILQPVTNTLALESADGEPEQNSKQSRVGEDRAQGPLIKHTPVILRRLHEVLSFFEDLPLSKVILTGSQGASDDLDALMQPWTIAVTQFGRSFVLNCEPLMQLSVLKDHLLTSTACHDPAFVAYCHTLVEDKAIFAQRSAHPKANCVLDINLYRVGQFVAFDQETGAHSIKYATKIVGDVGAGHQLEVDPDVHNLSEYFEFGITEERILIGCTKYIVLQRFKNTTRYEHKLFVRKLLNAQHMSENKSDSQPPAPWPRGTRVERATEGHTIVGCSHYNLLSSHQVFAYDLVSDSGALRRAVPQHEINTGIGLDAQLSRSRLRVAATMRDRSMRMIALRNLASSDDADQPKQLGAAVLKRRWSALSLLEELSPVDLNPSKVVDQAVSDKSKIQCLVDGVQVVVVTSSACIERSPGFRILFGVNDSAPTYDLGSCDMTVVSALQHLSEKNQQHEVKGLQVERKVSLHFSLQFLNTSSTAEAIDIQTIDSPTFRFGFTKPGRANEVCESRRRHHLNPAKEVGVSVSLEDLCSSPSWIDDSEAMAASCMQLIDSIGRLLHENEFSLIPDNWSETNHCRLFNAVDASLESRSLTEKLTSQLGQSLAVVGGALPHWCTQLPSSAPCLFSYKSRRQLLERTAFGVSRAAMSLQDAKVNVGPLRQRMAAIRGRAVELVSEAFSGGAEDPTSLQLQADELYGMEEALGARVSAAFKAQRWNERSLQCAKAAVHRGNLLSDAAIVMERYASSVMIRQRRLEIRFFGESGFDAASGDEAGVTRGFYADVAEALTSCQHVSTSSLNSTCSLDAGVPMQPDVIDQNLEFPEKAIAWPLWIPDLDSARKVIIPTPRANSRSTPGVFPRPLSPDDPHMKFVKEQFRFIGRIFACALRERFMFPLPLSCSFLKLVQMYTDEGADASVADVPASAKLRLMQNASDRATSPPSEHECTDDLSCEENTPTSGTSLLSDVGNGPFREQRHDSQLGLVSLDLPRPGFLGGEVYAIEQHICKELDRIDTLGLGEEATAERYTKIATNPKFAQIAFGKSFECSFEEYIEGKTFVDPMDASQGPSAMQLIDNGHSREVSIFNVREWVWLAKQFILRDGVIEQAKAFRDGVNDFFPCKYLRLFTAHELQRDVCGGSDNVEQWNEEDIKSLFKMNSANGASDSMVAVGSFGGEGDATLSRRFGSSSPTIGFLLKTLYCCTTTQRRQFLSFVTSVPIVTPGNIEVVPIVSPSGEFLPLADNCLPRANTCARRLYLPKFESYESFSSVLLSVIREESKFKGFYEWRG